MAGLKYWLWLATRKRLGLQGMHRVLEHFGTPERAYFADPAELKLLPDAVAQSLQERSMHAVEKIQEECERLGIRIMTMQDADYPERLRQIYNAPCILYLKGKLVDFDEQVIVGIVGARRSSEYGQAVADRLSMELCQGGAMLVSGIAAGIDSCAVRGALKVGGAPLCVLGGGIDMRYPWENRYLYDEVASEGLLISEYPPGTPNLGEHFPVRNRIISGLSVGIVVVEAREYGSGALITAEHALEQNRDVFAVPGNVDSEYSRGCIRLIQQGAKPVLCAEDILVEYRDLYPTKLSKTVPRPEQEPRLFYQQSGQGVDKKENVDYSLSRHTHQFTDDEKAILNVLASGSCQADEVVERAQIPTQRVLSALTMLQIDGLVEEKPGRRFAPCAE